MRAGVVESRRTLAIYVAAGAAFAALSARGLMVPLYAHGLGAGRFEVGALFSVGTLSAALLSMPSGVLIDRFGTRTLLVQTYGYATGFTACAVVAVMLALVMAAFHAEPLRPRSEIPLPPVAPGT